MRPLDLAGQKIGRLTVSAETKYDGHSRKWKCFCSCGAETWVAASQLQSYRTRSCGCLQKEMVSEARFRHGHSSKVKGVSPTYRIWQAMLQRCENPTDADYENYGGDGIRVCSEWHDFTAFLQDMGECPLSLSLDRIDNDGDYEPGNCRWATKQEQCNNTRRNHRITAFGKTRTLVEWGKVTGIRPSTIRKRLVDLNWPPERALTEPVKNATFRV